MMTDKIVVLATCGTVKEARRIARALVEARLAACVNIMPGAVESIYRWKGRIASAKERLVVIKTSRRRFAAVEREIRRLHSYQVPEIIALPVTQGSRDYMAWMSACISGSKK